MLGVPRDDATRHPLASTPRRGFSPVSWVACRRCALPKYTIPSRSILSQNLLVLYFFFPECYQSHLILRYHNRFAKPRQQGIEIQTTYLSCACSSPSRKNMVVSGLAASAAAMSNMSIVEPVGGGGQTEAAPLKNRAGESKNPFVKSHSRSPVAWQPLDDETIDRAKSEKKLIFLHIGYKACHC